MPLCLPRLVAFGCTALLVAAVLAGCAQQQAGLAGSATDTAGMAADTGTMAATTTTATASSAFNRFGGGGGSDSAMGPKRIANPTAADIAKAGPLGDMALGRDTAQLTVIEYISLTCPHCRRFHAETFQKIKKAYIDTGKVRWIVREFPIGHASGHAWLATRCTGDKHFFPVMETYLKEQASWVSQEVRLDEIYKIAAKSGLKRQAFDACIADKELEAKLKAVKDHGRLLNVIGTPTFFIGMRKEQGFFSYDDFKAMLDNPAGPAQTIASGQIPAAAAAQ